MPRGDKSAYTDKQKRKARHIDIFARLEATKRLGLVEDYRIDWQPSALSAPRLELLGVYPSIIGLTAQAAVLLVVLAFFLRNARPKAAGVGR